MLLFALTRTVFEKNVVASSDDDLLYFYLRTAALGGGTSCLFILTTVAPATSNAGSGITFTTTQHRRTCY